MIGISVTTRNRPNVFEFTLGKIKQHYTDEMRTVVINDSSTDQLDAYRKIIKSIGLPRLEVVENTERKGIPHSKNIAFQMLKDCDYQFWFDDDCYPICNDWHKPFIEGTEKDACHHYLYLKSWAHIKLKGEFGKMTKTFTHGTACLMYFTSEVYDVMEGFNEGFGIYGYWHGVLSKKMWEKGYAPWEYSTIKNCNKYVRCMDIDGSPPQLKGGFSSSMSSQERKKHLFG